MQTGDRSDVPCTADRQRPVQLPGKSAAVTAEQGCQQRPFITGQQLSGLFCHSAGKDPRPAQKRHGPTRINSFVFRLGYRQKNAFLQQIPTPVLFRRPQRALKHQNIPRSIVR